MKYFGDFATSKTVRIPFNTTSAAGASVTFTGTTFRVYKNSSTTQRSSSAGITLSKDFDSVTGMHLLEIDLSDNTDSGFYAAGNDYHVELHGATVDSQTVNAFIGSFSICNRSALRPATADRTLVVDASGLADANAVKIGPSGSGTAQTTGGDLAAMITAVDDYIDTEVAAIKAKTDNLPSDPADASDIAASFSSIASTLSTIAAYIDTEVAAIKAKTDNLPSDPADASDISALIAAINVICQSGTAQAGASSTITLASGAVATNDYYKNALVFIYSGTGAGQTPRLITGYVGSTRVATVDVAWVVNPDNTSVYKVLGYIKAA